MENPCNGQSCAQEPEACRKCGYPAGTGTQLDFGFPIRAEFPKGKRTGQTSLQALVEAAITATAIEQNK